LPDIFHVQAARDRAQGQTLEPETHVCTPTTWTTMPWTAHEERLAGELFRHVEAMPQRQTYFMEVRRAFTHAPARRAPPPPALRL
jgi:hypothetical protein